MAAVASPRVDAPGDPDAVVVLGPVGQDGALDRGVQLATAHPRGVLVVSTEGHEMAEDHGLCGSALGPSGKAAQCFLPEPMTTQGEARAVRDLARERGWQRVSVVTPAYHVSRARLLFDRCLSGTGTSVAVTDTGAALGFRRAAKEWVYQTLALLKDRIPVGC